MAFVFKPVTTRVHNGRKTRRRTRFYWACYADPVDGRERRHALRLPSGQRIGDREVAEAELRRLLLARQRLAVGLTDRFIEAAGTPVRKLLANYLRHLRRKRRGDGRPLSRGHVRQTLHVGKWLTNVGAQRVADLDAERIGRALAGLAHAGRSAKTINAYRGIVNGLCVYAVKVAGVLESNPVALVGPSGVNPVRRRRALTPDEAARLLAQAGARALWYETALLTGLRVGEIRALTWGDLDLDTLTPRIRLRAETTKGGRADVLPIKRTLADKLRAARPARADADGPVFATTPTRKTFRSDLKRAGIATRDDRGRTVDRHALRTTFVTWLSMSGVAPRTAQKLARHTSIDLTMKTYTDDTLLPASAAVEALPDLRDDGPDGERTALGATGTDNVRAGPVVLPVVPAVVLNGGERCYLDVNVGNDASASNAVTRSQCATKHDGSPAGKIGVTGFEPATSWSRTKRSSQAELHSGKPRIRVSSVSYRASSAKQVHGTGATARIRSGPRPPSSCRA